MKQSKLLSQEIVNQLAAAICRNLKKEFGDVKNLNEDVFLSIDELANFINMTKGSIYGLVHKNAIPYHKKGKLYFLKSEILDWIKEGKRETNSVLLNKVDEYLVKNPFQ